MHTRWVELELLPVDVHRDATESIETELESLLVTLGVKKNVDFANSTETKNCEPHVKARNLTSKYWSISDDQSSMRPSEATTSFGRRKKRIETSTQAAVQERCILPGAFELLDSGPLQKSV